MKTLQVNRLEQAMKEIKAIKGITEETIESIKTEIKPRERKLYHVALIKKVNNPAKEEYTTSVLVQSYNDRSFPNLKKNLVYLGFSQAIVLHDPSNEDLTVAPKATFESRKENQEAIADLTKKHNDEVAELKRKLAAKNAGEVVVDGTTDGGTDGGGDGSETITEIDVDKAKKDELIAFAQIKEIPLGDASKVDEIREVVKTWVESQAPTA